MGAGVSDGRPLGCGAVGILAALAAVAAPSAAQAATTQTFSTPGTSIYTVPSGVTQISIAAVGAAGGGWCANGGGGRGASVSGTFPVSGGEQVTVSVGGIGGVCGTTDTPGGIGGGGSTSGYAGGGGGASGVSVRYRRRDAWIGASRRRGRRRRGFRWGAWR